MNGLSPEQRSSLERTVVGLRKTLEQDLRATLAGRYGINEDGTIDAAGTLRLGSDEVQLREGLLEVLDVLREDSASAGDAVGRLVREAAFTHANRLTAVRIAEATDLLPESLSNGRTSTGYHEVLELSPRLRDDPFEGYWLYLRWCGDELAPDAPGLFDPRNPLLDLAPSLAAVDHLVALLADDDLSALWAVPDTLGWAYQFFNTPDERREMRESSAPRDSRELAVRNQFFTPSYVVSFLVENTLGRGLVESYGMAELAENLPLLVGHDEPDADALRLGDVRVLDPACGSGHFLLGCYDVLERAWELRGVGADQAAARILPCLYGIEIDPRAVQVATAALVLRARRAARTATLPNPEVMCARALPATAVAEVEGSLDASRRQLLRSMQAELDDAPVLGPLLLAEQRLQEALRRVVPEAAPGETLFRASGVVDEAMSKAEGDLLNALSRVADRAESTRAERLLTAEAADAVRFVDALRRRYDAVLMNPPFGEPIPSSKAYLKAAYPWLGATTNLFAAFVGRGLDLCRDGGYLGAITSRAGMFNTTFRVWREEILLGNRLAVVADLGGGVMEQAMVEAAAYVIQRGVRDANQIVPFFRLLDEPSRASALEEVIRNRRTGQTDHRLYEVANRDFESIPGKPVAYWMNPSLRNLFGELPAVEGNAGDVRPGVTSGDDFRFLRCAWEVAPSRVARNREDTRNGRRWVAFAKGGSYAPFWSDVHLVLDWENDGEVLRTAPSAGTRAQNTQFMFRAGVTWPLRTQGGFNPRLLPVGCGFGHKGPGVFPPPAADPLLLLAWVNSRPARCLLDAVATFGSYEVGAVQRLPWPGGKCDAFTPRIIENARVVASTVRLRDEIDEATRSFVAPELSQGRGTLAHRMESWYAEQDSREVLAIEAVGALERDWANILGLDAAAQKYIEDELGVPVWELPDRSATDDQADVLIEDFEAAAGSFTVSPTLEPLALALGLHPRRIAEARRGVGLGAEAKRRAAIRLASWLVGVSFGRWRLDATTQRAADLLDQLPINAPAEALGGSSTSMLLDEPGHPEDILHRIRGSAVRAFGDAADDILDELSGMLGARELRTYIRRGFFRDHLAMYSKSRREAPLYWQLSVPSRGWSIWLYAPTLTRETLHGILRHAERRMAVGAEESRRLRQEREAGGGRSARELDQRLDIEEGLLEELRVFRDEAGRLAGLGWNPDLEDGYALVAAMLRHLFVPRAWRKLDQLATDIAGGSFAWASLHEWREHA